MTEVDAGRQDVELPRLEYHTEDKDDDLLMDDYDVGLLGREYVLTFPATGLRMTRSPCGSADNEHKAKRSQHQPPLLDGSSTPSALSMPSLTSLPQCQASADNASQDTQAMSVSSPTLISASRTSNESGTPGPSTSRGRSTS
ncbi:hypothetical protein PI125_g24917 [Phytophthora idaei]|nr:hypothetical protein PI125_g24917 [Phytophthora idaei]